MPVRSCPPCKTISSWPFPVGPCFMAGPKRSKARKRERFAEDPLDWKDDGKRIAEATIVRAGVDACDAVRV